MNPKPLKERIREVLDELEENLFTGDRAMKEDIDHSLQAILTEIKENLPQKQTHAYDYPNGQWWKVEGYNAYHDKVEKLLGEAK